MYGCKHDSMALHCSQVNIGTVGESLRKWSSPSVLAWQSLVCEHGFHPGVSSLKGVLMEEVYFAAAGLPHIC